MEINQGSVEVLKRSDGRVVPKETIPEKKKRLDPSFKTPSQGSCSSSGIGFSRSSGN